MLAYILASAGAVVFFVTGFITRHFVQSKYLPLSSDARSLRTSVLEHLDAMINKSEIMIRHDAMAFRNLISGL